MNNWRSKKTVNKVDHQYHNQSAQTNRYSSGNHHNSDSHYDRKYGYIHETCIDEEEVRPLSNLFDPAAALDSFKNHWYQASYIMNSKCISYGFNPSVPKSKSITLDDVTSIVNHIDQMVALLFRDIKEHKLKSSDINNSELSPDFKSIILEFFLKEDILEKIFSWSRDLGEFTNSLKLEQLKIYELLLSQFSNGKIIFQQPVIEPLHKLLLTCRNCPCPLEVEKRLVVLLNTICVCIGRDNELLKLFFILDEQQSNNYHDFSSSHHGASSAFLSQQRKDIESKFLIFSLLISYVHREGAIGQQARDGLLQIMPISRTNEPLGHYIAHDSNLGPVMATILSGLYSSLPRKLSNLEERVQISEEDINERPELQIFLSSLDFCNAIVQISHPLIKRQMMDLIYQGFLVPVIGPALHEDTVKQIITTTAYLELCLRRVTEPDLLKIFLKFICIEKFDEQRILNTLIGRIQATTKLSLVTLILFRTIIDLNCEDVILELLLKYLIDLKHISSEDKFIKNTDSSLRFLNSAKKFISLVPSYCQIQTRSTSLNSSIDASHHSYDTDYYKSNSLVTISPQLSSFLESYFNYLDDAHTAIIKCKQRTQFWMTKYEMKTNDTNENHLVTPPSDSGIYLTTSSSSNNADTNKLVNETELTSHEPSLNNEAEMIGPLLSNILSRLSQLPFNDIHINLQLTGLVARLALFSEVHIKSILLDCNLRLHKNVRSLFSILSNLKKQLEELSTEIDGFNDHYAKAKNFLYLNDSLSRRTGSSVSEGSDISVKTSSDKKGKKRRSFASYLPWVSSHSTPSNKLQECPSLESLNDGYKFINKKNVQDEDEGIDGSAKSVENQRIIFAAIIFEEFVKELAAISQEHYLLSDVDGNLIIESEFLLP